jgi:hypothetical protein
MVDTVPNLKKNIGENSPVCYNDQTIETKLLYKELHISST